MGLFNKLAFWKNESESVLPESVELPASDVDIRHALPQRLSPLSEPGFEPAPTAFSAQISQPQLSSNFDAELRVISAKLDTIKAVLDVITQRLDRLDGKKDELTRWR